MEYVLLLQNVLKTEKKKKRSTGEAAVWCVCSKYKLNVRKPLQKKKHANTPVCNQEHWKAQTRVHSVNHPFKKRHEHKFACLAAYVLTNAALSCTKQNGKNPAVIKRSHIPQTHSSPADMTHGWPRGSLGKKKYSSSSTMCRNDG